MPRDEPSSRRATISSTLADFAAGLNWDAIPAEIRTRAKHHILDAVGIALAAGTFDFAHRTLTALNGLSGGAAGTVGVIGKSMRLAPRDAALANGILCHGLDFDDTHLGGVVHATVSSMPCALSAGVLAGASGRDLVVAYILGIEVAARLGSVAKGGFHQVGFHPTGLVGAFSSALVAGKLFGLSAGQLAHAQGIALSMGSGSLEFLEDGAWTKRMHPGWAASSGITAAALAREGFIGATAPYEGRFGLYNAFLGPRAAECDLDLATAGLGSRWELSHTAIKPFPACHFTHGCIDAAIKLAPEVDTGAIRRIRALVPGEVVKTVCEPVANKKRPANSYDAQFSIPYLVAVGLRHGRMALADIERPMLDDPEILAIADKVDYEVDPKSGFPRHYSGEVIVEMTDGRVLNHREQINRGAPDRPLTNGEIIEKYRTNASLAVSTERSQAIEAAVLACHESDAAALSASLTR
ncbi:2-methylcitrate dehydratase [Skermanella stibiiresistens SB22]|uniref:2-methylcitrate dehydratase n=1 Tax=Skermanella stibiiresistens SB22 TaxID=1385369 RepID=W9GYV7_9PROT|nr:MmgE/PrpD family protein [Skermanella stibiiresistens]EWY37796.1 2-methylcitrate dehydratase [Skermanella stibiiresistens SB22]